jgi:flagellar biosynthetic protein FliQ
MGGIWACPARRAGWREPKMNPDLVGQLAREALETTLFLSLPILGIGLIVGLLVSLFQAVTQIQEATLVFVPKIVVVFVALLLLSPWMMRKMMFYTEQLIVNLPLFVK